MPNPNKPLTLDTVTPLDAAVCRERLLHKEPASPYILAWLEDDRFRVVRQIPIKRYGTRTLALEGRLQPVPDGTRVQAAITPKTYDEFNTRSRSFLTIVIVFMSVIALVFLLNREWIGLLASVAFTAMTVYSYRVRLRNDRAMFAAMIAWLRDALESPAAPPA